MNSLKIILRNFRYFSPVWVFASINILMGSWVLYIPYVKKKLGLDDGELGIALFCYALGILVMIPLISSITQRLGIGRYTILGIVLFTLASLFPILSESYLWLCCSLFMVGLFSGSTDITMNALVSEIEKRDEVNFMSAAHGFFSLGGVIGAGLGSFLLIDVLEPATHIFLISAVIALTNLFLAKHYYRIKEEVEEGQKEKSRFQLEKYMPLIAISFIAFAIMGSEGAIENWSKLYLLDVLNVSSEQVAGYGFILFSTTMTLGRFFGDGISDTYGSDKVIIGGCLVAVIAFGGILSSQLYISILGFGILGLGLSVIIPELFRIAGKVKGISPTASIAFVSGVGFLGFLMGPVVLGFISKAASLKISFVALLGVTAFASLLAILRRKESPSGS